MSKFPLDTSKHHSDAQHTLDRALPSGRRGRSVKVKRGNIADSFDRSDILQTNMIENARISQIPSFGAICYTRVLLANVLERIKYTLRWEELNYALLSGYNEKNKNVGSK
jgi:hypothetical protein